LSCAYSGYLQADQWEWKRARLVAYYASAAYGDKNYKMTDIIDFGDEDAKKAVVNQKDKHELYKLLPKHLN
jgi:hypothetical protein